jgi:hypothetical protein
MNSNSSESLDRWIEAMVEGSGGPHHFVTYQGHTVSLRAPKAETIDPVDIAHSLAHICRYYGHVDRYFSVAEHSCLCAGLATAQGESSEVVLACALHDGSEAYLGDVITPVKQLLANSDVAYSDLSNAMDRTIERRFKLPELALKHERVRYYDKWALCLEIAMLRPHTASPYIEIPDLPHGVKVGEWGWKPLTAKLRFLSELSNLTLREGSAV